MKPRIFIGSSKEYIEIAEAIHSNISSFSFPEIWDQSITTLSNSTLKNLIDSLNNYKFAIFVLGGEDSAQIRGVDVNISRDNIIFEVGLFMGKLGHERVFIIKPSDIELHIPTDLLGITYGEYDSNHPNKESAVRKFCNQVKAQINKTDQPILPNDGLFGENILNNELIKLNSNSLDLSAHTYGLYAQTTPYQKISVVITNMSSSQMSNCWRIDITNRNGWISSKYNGSQKFELLPDTNGLLKLFFTGNGKAIINVFLNEELIMEKNIAWD